MIRRSTLVLVILFVLVAGVAVYLQKRPAASGSTQASVTPAPALLNIVSTSVTGFQLVDKDGQIVIKVGSGGQWNVEQPANGTITAGNIQEILSELTSMKVTVSLPAAPPEDATGLNQPSYTLTISSTTGPDRVIKVGKAPPTDIGYYVQVDQALPVVIGKYGIDRVVELLRSTRATPTPPATASPFQASPGQTPTPAAAP